MSRNYGLGSRHMHEAIKVALRHDREIGRFSFATEKSLATRFNQFQKFAKAQGVGRLERVNTALVQSYSQYLKGSSYSTQYKHALLSAVNSVMDSVRAYVNAEPWTPVTARREGIEARNFVRVAPTITNEQYYQAREAMTPRLQGLSDISRELGLRLKEAALLDNKKGLREALKHGRLTIEKGTKGGKKRSVSISNERQISALKHAATLQGRGRSLIPETQNYRQFLDGEIRANRNALHAAGISRYHELRSAYAAQRYEELTGHLAPVNGGFIADRQLDHQVRLQISAELGHGRVEVVASYIGGRK